MPLATSCKACRRSFDLVVQFRCQRSDSGELLGPYDGLHVITQHAIGHQRQGTKHRAGTPQGKQRYPQLKDCQGLDAMLPDDVASPRPMIA